MGWRYVLVRAFVPEGSHGHPEHPIVLPPERPPGEIWPDPGPLPHPEHPIAPGGPPPSVWPGPGYPAHPIAPGGEHPMPPIYNPPPVDPGYGVPGPPPQVWPDPGHPAHPIAPGGEHPAHPIAPGGPPPVVMPPIYYPPEIWPDPNPPGIWGPTDPRPQPPIYLPPEGGAPPVDSGAHPEHPIYWPPVIWPDPPEGLPSFDPDQLPQHPDLPDLNHGVWYWVEHNDALTRAFIAQVVRPSHDLPDYQPKLPPEASQPGQWVVCLLAPQRPAWAWIPSDPTPEVPDNPHVPDMGARPEHPITLPPPDSGGGDGGDEGEGEDRRRLRR